MPELSGEPQRRHDCDKGWNVDYKTTGDHHQGCPTDLTLNIPVHLSYLDIPLI